MKGILLLLQLPLGVVEGVDLDLLIAIFQVKLGVLRVELHQVCVRLDVSLLLLFIAIDPDFSCVFLGSDLLILLHDLVNQLLALDFVLFFQRLVLDRQVFDFAFGIEQLLCFYFESLPVSNHHLVSLYKLVFDILKLFP